VAGEGGAAYSPTIESRTTPDGAVHHRKEPIMSNSITTQVASFFLAALMTVGLLGSIQDLAKVETRLGAANALVAQAAPATRHA
jgi:hypothetical protein